MRLLFCFTPGWDSSTVCCLHASELTSRDHIATIQSCLHHHRSLRRLALRQSLNTFTMHRLAEGSIETHLSNTIAESTEQYHLVYLPDFQPPQTRQNTSMAKQSKSAVITRVFCLRTGRGLNSEQAKSHRYLECHVQDHLIVIRTHSAVPIHCKGK